MAEKTSRRAETDSPKSASRIVRESARAIRSSRQGIGQHRAEYLALIAWAEAQGCLLPLGYIDQFTSIGSGAEHRVFKDEGRIMLAIKATHPNKFGYCTDESQYWATPVQYLRRLAWQNLIFGDDIRIVGVSYEDDQMEVITSQPWISVHEIRPNPTKAEIDTYMGNFAFQTTSLDLDTPPYYSKHWGLVALDAHDRNVVRDQQENLAGIDLVIGPPTWNFLQQLRDLEKDPAVPF